jgi:hypothetical protein
MAQKKKNSPKKLPPINELKRWEYKPEYSAVALIRKDSLWSVLTLKLQEKNVVSHEITTETSFEYAIDKAIRKLAQSVRKI